MCFRIKIFRFAYLRKKKPFKRQSEARRMGKDECKYLASIYSLELQSMRLAFTIFFEVAKIQLHLSMLCWQTALYYQLPF